MKICSLRNENLQLQEKQGTTRGLFLLRLLEYSKQKIPPKKLFRPEKFNLSSGAQVKPCWSGLRTGWVTHCEDRLKRPYLVLSFLLLLFCVLCGVIVNSVLKSRFSIQRLHLEKEKNKEQIWPGAVRRKIIILRAVIQSRNFRL